MTVSNEASSVSYTGTGSRYIFPITFEFQDSTTIAVYVDGDKQTPTTEYTVSGTDVVMVVEPPLDSVVLIQREVTLTQPIEFRTQGSFSPSVHEDQLDRIVFQVQQISRTLTNLVATVADIAADVADIIAGGGGGGGDIPDATHTVAGKVSLSAQDMGAGLKTFVDGLNAGNHVLAGVDGGVADTDAANTFQLNGVNALAEQADLKTGVHTYELADSDTSIDMTGAANLHEVAVIRFTGPTNAVSVDSMINVPSDLVLVTFLHDAADTGYITFVHGVLFRLVGAGDLVLGPGGSLVLAKGNGFWFEVSRSQIA